MSLTGASMLFLGTVFSLFTARKKFRSTFGMRVDKISTPDNTGERQKVSYAGKPIQRFIVRLAHKRAGR